MNEPKKNLTSLAGPAILVALLGAGLTAVIADRPCSLSAGQPAVGLIVSTARRLASVLGVPTPYLFAEDDTVADIILVLGNLSLRDRRKILAELKEHPKTKAR